MQARTGDCSPFCKEIPRLACGPAAPIDSIHYDCVSQVLSGGRRFCRHRRSCLFNEEAAAEKTGCFWFPSINTKRSRSEGKTAQRKATIQSWRPGESGNPSPGQKHISHGCRHHLFFCFIYRRRPQLWFKKKKTPENLWVPIAVCECVCVHSRCSVVF